MRFFTFIKILLFFCVFLNVAEAQDTNPVERQVANPLTDTPNVNPLSVDQTQTAQPKKKPTQTSGALVGDDQLSIDYDKITSTGKEGERIIVHTGNVDVHYDVYRLQADKITYYEADGRLVAEGNVVFDQNEDQRITGTRGEFNYRTKLGYFLNSTGFTNQTDDGTVIYFTALRVDRVAVNEIVVTGGQFTACDENVPKWSFSATEARIRPNDRIRLKNAKFRLKNVPIIPIPYASIPIKKRDRASGFLTPTFGFSGDKGARLAGAYYQTLGRSADVTFRGDLYSSRGVGFGMDVRTRANSRSFLNFGFYGVKDRIFGNSENAENPDQGGSLIYADGVHYFSNGYTAVADVRLTSNLAFRQVFSDGIQQIISPIELSQVYLNKSWDNYTLNLRARSEVITIPNVRIKTRNLPSVDFEKRPSEISFLKGAYFSFKTSLEGVNRREDVDDAALYEQLAGNEPVITPTLGHRIDVHPQITVPLSFKYFNLTATAGGRVTHYSNSFNDMRRVVGADVVRKYGEFELDFRPVALARNYYGKADAFRFRHTIEPFLKYRYVKGINNFDRIIRFDSADTQTDRNEIEFGVTNRFFTRRYTEAVTEQAQNYLSQNPNAQKNPLSVQPYEIFTLTVRGKYFFDKNFGGALAPGRRNQIDPLTDLTFYTFGGVPRNLSPINIDATYRPRKTIYVNTRLDIGMQGEGVRDISSTVGYDTKLVKLFQTFYYTRAVTLMPSMRQFANSSGVEAGTVRGSQYSPSVFIGDRDRGFYGGASLFFDFENRRALRFTPLISSLYTVGYAFDCCAATVQYYTFNVGVRQENRFVFSFRLNGIGTFGTEQFGQGFR